MLEFLVFERLPFQCYPGLLRLSCGDARGDLFNSVVLGYVELSSRGAVVVECFTQGGSLFLGAVLSGSVESMN